MTRTEITDIKENLMKNFGYISFQLVFANLDAIAIRLKSNAEIILIIYRGEKKIGFIYDGGILEPIRVAEIYKHAPDNYNDLEKYESSLKQKIDVLQLIKHNYVFLNENEVTPQKKIKNEK